MGNYEQETGKDIIKSIKSNVDDDLDLDEDQVKELHEKMTDIKNRIKELILELAEAYNNKIPFLALKEKSGLEYQVIQEAIMQLQMSNDLLGFINDNSTSELSDDVFIFRDKRILDSIEPDYRVG